MKHLIVTIGFIVFTQNAFATSAQPVPIPEDSSILPQVEIDGVGIGTLNFARTGEHPKSESGINFSDSALFIGGAQRLYNGAIGSFGIGQLAIDESNKGTTSSLFLYQTFVDYQSESFEAFVGRGDNPNAHLVDFPTLRGDDLATLTNPMNPFSNGKNLEEHRYSNVASVSFNQKLTYFENFHVQHLINSAAIGTDTGINSFGLTLQYLTTAGMEVFGRIPSFAVGYEHLIVGLDQFYLGGVLRLNESVTHRFDLRVQDSLNVGSALSGLKTVNDSYQASSNTITAALRYLDQPFGGAGYQVSLTGAFQNYFKINQAKSYGLIATGVKQLGKGFDLVAQYQGQQRDSSLAIVQANGVAYEQTFELGFIFNFNATINQHISPRRTMLNQQYQYIPE